MQTLNLNILNPENPKPLSVFSEGACLVRADGSGAALNVTG